MLFNSLDFLIFLGLFFALWPLVRARRNWRWIYLTAASFVFYGWWDWRFLFLIIASGLLDFVAALAMVRFPRWKTACLVTSIVGNVGSLVVFKYLDFLIENTNALLGLASMESHIPLAGLILPIGISFYTFQSMSYTIDVYRGKLEPTRNLFHFFAYLSLFPQLVAGPIVRASQLLPQLLEARRTTKAERWEGLRLIVHGFFKKVVVADSIARYVNAAFGSAHPEPSCCYWWVIMMMFALQIYCDFSGYSDVARGLARWMGYEFPRNFDHPYISSSMREFWSRWHISLSTWFRDYVYIPLGGSQQGALKSHRNMWVTMLVSGVWHGASWTFVIWGALHALCLSLERVTRWPSRLASLPLGRHLATLLTLSLVLISWVFFRATSLGQSIQILYAMFNLAALNFATVTELIGPRGLGLMLLMLARELYFYLGLNTCKLAQSRMHLGLQPAVVACLIAACVFLRGPGSAFIYFQF